MKNLILVLSLILLIACGQDEAYSTTYTATNQLCWTKSSTDANGNTITVDGYKVLWGVSTGSYLYTYDAGATGTPSAPCVTMGSLNFQNGPIYLVIIAYKSGYNDSGYSTPEFQFTYSSGVVTTTTTTSTTTTTGTGPTTTTTSTTTTSTSPPPVESGLCIGTGRCVTAGTRNPVVR